MGPRRSRSRSRSASQSAVRRRAAAAAPPSAPQTAPAAAKRSVSSTREAAPAAPAVASPAGPSQRARAQLASGKFLTLAEMKTKKALAFLTDSELILSGYRVPAGWWGALKSTMALHNETFNVWSHLGSAIVFGAILVYFSLQGIPPRSHGVVAWASAPSEVYIPAAAPPLPPAAAAAAPARGATPQELGSLHGLESEFAGLVNNFLDAVVPVETTTAGSGVTAGAGAPTAAPNHPTSVLEAKHWLQEMAGWVRAHLPGGGDGVAPSAGPPPAAPAQDLRQLGLQPRPGGLQEHLLHAIDKVTAALPLLPADVSHVASELVRGGARLAALLKALPTADSANAPLFMDDGVTLSELQQQEQALHPHQSAIPIWPVLGYLFTAVACFTFSAAFHLLYPVSKRVFRYFNKLDFVGIALLIMGSNFPVITYGFYCEPSLSVLYTTMAAASSAVCIWASFSSTFALPKYRTMRALSFVATAVIGAIPFLHLVFFSKAQCWEALMGLLHTGILYLFGAFLYATRIPERYKPGRFDLIGSSHNLFHLLVTTAVAVHLLASLDHYHWRSSRSVCDAPAL